MAIMTIDILCPHCGADSIITVDRETRNELQTCPACDSYGAVRIPSLPNVTRKSYVDGTKRFDSIRETHKLRMNKLSAKDSGDRESMKKIDNEIKKVNKIGD
jgi:transcription elongation factor Elf1